MRLIGHRGARGEAPENTLSGFRYLRDLGVLAVELDIQVTADRQLVVIHDNALDRTTHGSGAVDQTHSRDLAGVDATRKAFPDWPVVEGVPLLRDVMAVLKDFNHIQFEVKAASERDTLRVAEELPRLWAEFGFGQRAMTTSFNPRYLELVRNLAPELPRGFLFEQDYAGNPVEQALALGCVAIGPHQARCDPALVQAVRANGLAVSTWTVNDPERMRTLHQLGIDGVITDVPALALQACPELFPPAHHD